MLLWLMSIACVFETNGGGDADTDDTEDLVVTYEADSGVACIEGTAGFETDVIVDFGDCLFCSRDSTLWCEARLEGTTTVVVNAGGSVTVHGDCGTNGTCEPTHADCDAPDLAAGNYTLSYGGVEVPFTLPTGNWTCTGESGIL